MNTRERNLIFIDDTRFIFRTNFSGDPSRDSFGSDKRRFNIVIPSERQAFDLMDAGFNVKQTKPRPGYEDEFVPTYFVAVNVGYDGKTPPNINLVTDDIVTQLNEDTVDILDGIYVKNVNAVLNPYVNQRTGGKSLYVRTLYVEQDMEEDPYASRYSRRVSDRDLPF